MSESATDSLVGGDLLRRWVWLVALGETVGFMIPAAVWGGLATAGLSDAVVYLPVVLAGALEGAVLGWAQSCVLRDVLAGFVARDWIRNTALAAGGAWSLGMLPSLLQAAFGEDVPDALLIVVGVSGGVVMLLSIGWAQSLVLRDHVPRTGRWIAINALAWFAGLPFTFVALSVAPDDAIAHVIAAAIGGLCMAATVALLTGLVLTRMLRPVSNRDG